jgi:hypothetical protein
MEDGHDLDCLMLESGRGQNLAAIHSLLGPPEPLTLEEIEALVCSWVKPRMLMAYLSHEVNAPESRQFEGMSPGTRPAA